MGLSGILLYPNDVLKQKSLPVEDFKAMAFRELVGELKEDLLGSETGVGLAAPQIGVNLRVFAVKDAEGRVTILTNPQIVRKSLQVKCSEEGCLSFPGQYGLVRRSVEVLLGFFDENGKRQVGKFNGWMARVVQHEVDHLDGILFIERMVGA
ncbi:MAG: peptide deformylase [Candidatus Paceibacterota bacterium]